MSEWIEWNGDVCPVDLWVKVEVELRNGSTAEAFSNNFIWVTTGGMGDIVKYKVVEYEPKADRPRDTKEPNWDNAPDDAEYWNPIAGNWWKDGGEEGVYCYDVGVWSLLPNLVIHPDYIKRPEAEPPCPVKEFADTCHQVTEQMSAEPRPITHAEPADSPGLAKAIDQNQEPLYDWVGPITHVPPVVAKPPLGLMPRKMHNIMRGIAILNAMKRYTENEMPIPEEWLAELQDLSKYNV